METLARNGPHWDDEKKNLRNMQHVFEQDYLWGGGRVRRKGEKRQKDRKCIVLYSIGASIGCADTVHGTMTRGNFV